jgi:hypothetical protein
LPRTWPAMSLQHAMVKGSRRIRAPFCMGDGARAALINETPARATLAERSDPRGPAVIVARAGLLEGRCHQRIVGVAAIRREPPLLGALEDGGPRVHVGSCQLLDDRGVGERIEMQVGDDQEHALARPGRERQGSVPPSVAQAPSASSAAIPTIARARTLRTVPNRLLIVKATYRKISGGSGAGSAHASGGTCSGAGPTPLRDLGARPVDRHAVGSDRGPEGNAKREPARA